MRLSRYMRVTENIMLLPQKLDVEENCNFFNYNPQNCAMHQLIKQARRDDSLLTHELIELYNYTERLQNKGGNR